MSSLIEKELKWPGSRRKKIFKNRMKRTVQGVLKEYKDNVPPRTNLHLIEKEMLDIVIGTLNSKSFQESLEKK